MLKRQAMSKAEKLNFLQGLHIKRPVFYGGWLRSV